MYHGPLLNSHRPFAKPKNIDSLHGFSIYRLLDEDASRIQFPLIPTCADQVDRRKPGKCALLNHGLEVIEERRGIFREHLLEMILTYPGRMCLPRQCFDDVHNRFKYTQKKSANQITGSSTGTARSLSRVEINNFGDYDALHAILEQSGDMVAIYADYPDNAPTGDGSYIGTAQFDNDYADAIEFTVLNTQTNIYYQGSVRPSGDVAWTGAWGGIKETFSIADFTPAALFAAPYNFHLYPNGTMIPIEGAQQAEQGPFPESIYDTAGYVMVQYGNNHTGSALRQVMVVLHEVGTIAGQPGRMAYATISKGGLNPRWQIIGDSQWLWTGDKALSANVTASLPLTDYTRRTGDRLEIYYAYLGGGTEGHIMGFNNAVSVMYNPAETLTQSFFTLVTSGGSASQLEAQFEFRMSGSTLQIVGRNLNTGSVNVVSQFRIKGVKLVR
nr:MAG TPA: hypothetical protein [Caudoviricetes sp.]